jgi:hypothetical protein
VDLVSPQPKKLNYWDFDFLSKVMKRRGRINVDVPSSGD